MENSDWDKGVNMKNLCPVCKNKVNIYVTSQIVINFFAELILYSFLAVSRALVWNWRGVSKTR